MSMVANTFKHPQHSSLKEIENEWWQSLITENDISRRKTEFKTNRNAPCPSKFQLKPSHSQFLFSIISIKCSLNGGNRPPFMQSESFLRPKALFISKSGVRLILSGMSINLKMTKINQKISFRVGHIWLKNFNLALPWNFSSLTIKTKISPVFLSIICLKRVPKNLTYQSHK